MKKKKTTDLSWCWCGVAFVNLFRELESLREHVLGFFGGEIRILYIIYGRDKVSRRRRGATLTDTSSYQSHVTHPLKFDKIGLNKEKTRNTQKCDTGS